ncbi:hypothetical protein [Clostridium botulinum]|uniref:hypothetical protein n=1 Tax=Clostridium botulinum TaxID=1491 RepID=UPI0004D3EB5F|nr:hypothetical protein [Clostridium botulinum]KEH99964.1 hypothetical protein Z952_14685 [Clostridium botulinum C/D str. BKT75002]KEI05686.1 hypothetical protein Z954_14865 [Clostridium botulinum C/D str. BKT2873]MCD3351760.1 hypothetical protein [Clostridium botulinum D/C]MCD3360686.1 hypothetical protein [Clostridium botulinum D/C]MCD3362112.1 hypothetical protein [Clostridium botulinum D/C]
MKRMNFRDPVEYIVKRYEKKIGTKISVILDADNPNLNLPEYPVKLVRDNTKKVVKVIYAEDTSSEWSKELIRNSEGYVYKIKTIFPDGSSKTVEIFKSDNMVDNINYV